MPKKTRENERKRENERNENDHKRYKFIDTLNNLSMWNSIMTEVTYLNCIKYPTNQERDINI